ncbi:hypothetical protein CC78DRAFT_586718 [Lojkania enalia]|uniref:Uncharacterized protein n=1 Tax=Lojkania enalia TaxID=147567 RepID=A0A9P4MYR6_9PLEO|nr:hypothetical protein CC78DRAFT_586718 [Didymosphaeria enalia]
MQDQVEVQQLVTRARAERLASLRLYSPPPSEIDASTRADINRHTAPGVKLGPTLFSGGRGGAFQELLRVRGIAAISTLGGIQLCSSAQSGPPVRPVHQWPCVAGPSFHFALIEGPPSAVDWTVIFMVTQGEFLGVGYGECRWSRKSNGSST